MSHYVVLQPMHPALSGDTTSDSPVDVNTAFYMAAAVVLGVIGIAALAVGGAVASEMYKPTKDPWARKPQAQDRSGWMGTHRLPVPTEDDEVRHLRSIRDDKWGSSW
jgi:hypothetical protein